MIFFMEWWKYTNFPGMHAVHNCRDKTDNPHYCLLHHYIISVNFCKVDTWTLAEGLCQVYIDVWAEKFHFDLPFVCSFIMYFLLPLYTLLSHMDDPTAWFLTPVRFLPVFFFTACGIFNKHTCCTPHDTGFFSFPPQVLTVSLLPWD